MVGRARDDSWRLRAFTGAIPLVTPMLQQRFGRASATTSATSQLYAITKLGGSCPVGRLHGSWRLAGFVGDCQYRKPIVCGETLADGLQFRTSVKSYALTSLSMNKSAIWLHAEEFSRIAIHSDLKNLSG